MSDIVGHYGEHLIPNTFRSIFSACVKIYAKYFGLVSNEYNVYDEYKTLQARLKKFEDVKDKWHIDIISSYEFAEAGFIPRGSNGVQCFCCGTILLEWQITDNPWIEHERLGNDCPYINLNSEKIFLRKQYYTESSKGYLNSLWNTNDIQKLLVKGKLHNMVKALLFQYKKLEYFDYNKVEKYYNKELNYPKEKINDEKLCDTCCDEIKNILFIPCGHIIACSLCALSFRQCSYCSATIKAFTKVFYTK